jgi:hypothetical protein
MSTKTLFRWEQDGHGGDHGTLILWPGTKNELRLQVQDFKTANTLGMRINGLEKEQFENGRRSFKDDVARLVV